MKVFNHQAVACSAHRALIERLSHYFMTYKLVPDTEPRVSIETVYGRKYAMGVVEASMRDYEDEFGQ